DFSVTRSPDPRITYRGTIVDIGAPSTFNFIFAQAIVNTAAPGIASNTLSSNTTDGNGNGVLVTPAAPPGIIPVDSDGIPEIAKYTVSLDGGSTFLSAGLDSGHRFNDAPGS